MSKLELIRATPANGLFQRLKDEWQAQLAHEDAPTTLYIPMMEHAERISKEDPPDKRYGIFVVARLDDEGNEEAREGLVHINHALPKTSAAALRLVWNLVAPRYAYEEIEPGHLGGILATFLTGALRLSTTDMRSGEVRMYLGNAMDRAFAKMIIERIADQLPEFKFAIGGGWLHISFATR